MAENRRLSTRVPFENTCFLIVDGNRLPARVLDLSIKGALVTQEDVSHYEKDALCELELSLEMEGVLLNVNGTMAHSEGNRIGIHFTHIDIDSLTHLRRIIELNLGDPEKTVEELALWSGGTR